MVGCSLLTVAASVLTVQPFRGAVTQGVDDSPVVGQQHLGECPSAIYSVASLAHSDGPPYPADRLFAVNGWLPAALQVPGQTRILEAPRQGEGWILLEWKAPADGGAVASYKIDRRERPVGDWMLISLAMESEATLNNQERGKDWEYRVTAVNKGGEVEPSNTAMAVL